MVRRVLVTATVGFLLLGGIGVPAAQASTTAVAAARTAEGRGGDYLALGDSVPFGYSPLVPIGSDPGQYVGYPQLAAPELKLKVTDLACPGQTTGGFLTLSGDDNGCFIFRRFASLHTDYPGSQLDAALGFLITHPRTKLVSLMLGGNDLRLCQATTADGCTSPAEVAATLQSAAAHLAVALAAIRQVYHGPLITVTYYATDYANPAEVATIAALDSTLGAVTASFGGSTVDGFTPFLKASARFGGNACAAGLLVILPTGGCDIHPSARGTQLLARALVKVADR
jgi:lysophospholipase L1-like esterase